MNVSIHALAKRATEYEKVAEYIERFQSTPSRRGRHAAAGVASTETCFNPRPREEGDPAGYPTGQVILVSIHALAKRATMRPAPTRNSTSCFNPRPREEGDEMRFASSSVSQQFQSTPSRRGRRSSSGLVPLIGLFQSTPSRRGRPMVRP